MIPYCGDMMVSGKALTKNEVQPGSRKAGVFWHNQGSGKSIFMCCYAGKLLQQPAMKNPTLVVVTDRNELGGQLYQQFCMARDTGGYRRHVAPYAAAPDLIAAAPVCSHLVIQITTGLRRPARPAFAAR